MDAMSNPWLVGAGTQRRCQACNSILLDSGVCLDCSNEDLLGRGFGIEAPTEAVYHDLSYLMTPKAKVPISSISPIFWGGGLDFPGAHGIETETRPHPRKDGRDGQDGNLSLGSH